MASRQTALAEARFMRGDTGVDGAATREVADPLVAEQAKAREGLYRGRTWLGREALTWLLWRSESADDLLTVEGQPLKVLFTGKLMLLLLVYIREDAVVVRQPIYGLLIGNLLLFALAFLTRQHGTESVQIGRAHV